MSYAEPLFGWDRERDAPVIRQLVVRDSDPSTSHHAAQRTHGRGKSRRRVYAALRENPAGLTDFELAKLTGLQQNSAGKRRGELRDEGKVEDSGERRPSPTGTRAIVWRIRT
jgi:hypothetical protein